MYTFRLSYINHIILLNILFKTGDSTELNKHGCKSPCIYTAENDESQEVCFGKGTLDSECLADQLQGEYISHMYLMYMLLSLWDVMTDE